MVTSVPADALELVARIPTASNETFLARLGGSEVIYKPSAGEQPLWDFPNGDLARRELAAYLVSEELGWNIVPRTWLGDGPLGPGMVQLWQHTTGTAAIEVLPTDAVPHDGWRVVFEGEDEHGRTVALVHEDSAALRRMAVFDALVNNADRKGGHVLVMQHGHRFGVDHGLTFHVEHKLRTVLWGWVGEPLNANETRGIERLRASIDGELGVRLAELIEGDEIEALADRCDTLLALPVFPAPSGWMPATPWPLF